MKSVSSWTLQLLTLMASLFLSTALLAADKPNVVILLADDLGYGETSCYGCKDIPTPHIDSIAKSGVRFTNGYVSGPYCSPTRAGLMTGRYQTRFGHEWNPGGGDKEKLGLPLTETTFPQRMKDLGYKTCCIGKWHLGAAKHFHPTQRGFDEFFGTLNNTPFYHPTSFIDSRKSPEIQKITDNDFYTTDQYAARAVDWIGTHKKEPFLLYIPFNAQHAPLQAPESYQRRFPEIHNEKRKIFAGMMAAMDDAVGKILSSLKEHGLEENTLVVFLADNGGPTPQTTSNNGPLRGTKMTTSEGGVRVPFVAQWKGTIPAGMTYEHPVIQLDLVSTAIAMAGGTISPDWKLDGVNLLPYLTGKAEGRPHDSLFWRMGPQWAVRHGDWKLVASKVDQNQPRLIDLNQDIGEEYDLSAKHPEKKAELQALYDSWNKEQATALWLPKDPGNAKPNAGKKKKDAKAAKKGKASAE